MTEFNPGDRVHVTFDGIYRGANIKSGWASVTPSDARIGTVGVPLESLELLPDPLPTTPGLYVNANDINRIAEGMPIYRLSPSYGWIDGDEYVRAAMPLVQLIPKTEADL